MLHLPTPRELGQPSDFLPLRSWNPKAIGYTWEDWHAEVKRRYPFRYWLVETIPAFFAPAIRRVSDAWYWLKCHLLPWRRYHLLDLRGVDPLAGYTHGYMDPCEVLRVSAWAALRIYVEKECPADPASWASPEELNEFPLRDQKAAYDEAMTLYRWWMQDRSAEKALVDEAYATYLAAQNGDRGRKLNAWTALADAADVKDEAMLLRLVKLRPYLWT